jgi:FKBP-type peptidyl-prolyl cis-trans isomerase
MKPNSLLPILLLSLGVTAAGFAQEVTLNIPGKPAENATATPPANVPAALAAAPAPTEAQILETFGWFVAGRVGIQQLEFSDAQIAHFIKGVAAAAAGREAPYELAQVGPAMDEFIQARQEAVLAKEKQRNEAAAAKFFADLKGNPAVKELPSGLRYEIVQPGTGANPTVKDTVTIHYTGALIDGRVFDSSLQRGQPEEVALGNVIDGWAEGVQLINKGGKIKLYIPAHLAYGDQPAGDIPPGSTLIFDVELIDFKPTPPPVAEAAPAAK